MNMEDRKETNIVIIGANIKLINEVSNKLALSLDMYYLDLQGLFEFDISPITMKELLKKNGINYFRKKQSGIVSYAKTFENTVISVESGVAKNLNNIEVLDQNGLLIFLYEDYKQLKATLSKLKYNSKEEKSLYYLSKIDYAKIIETIREFVDIEIDTTALNYENIVDKIKKEIINYYGV